MLTFLAQACKHSIVTEPTKDQLLYFRRAPSTELTPFHFVVPCAAAPPQTHCYPMVRQKAARALQVNRLGLKCLFCRHRSACGSLSSRWVIGRLALPLFPARGADVRHLITTAPKGREEEDDEEPSGRRYKLLCVPESSSLLLFFLFGCHFSLSLKMFPDICRQQQHPGTKEPLINCFIAIMTMHCVAMEKVSAVITCWNTSQQLVINVTLL